MTNIQRCDPAFHVSTYTAPVANESVRAPKEASDTLCVDVEFNAYKLEKLLHAGDIVSVQLTKAVGQSLAFYDRAIGWSQQASRFAHAQRHTQDAGVIHMGLYIGKGEVAESTPNTTIALPLSDPSWQLKPGDAMCYRITRLKNPKLAKAGADIARHLAQKTIFAPQFKHSYSMLLAANSLFHNSHFGQRARARLFEAYALGNLANKPFYCSYFVAFALQKAEADPLINALLEAYPHLKPPVPPVRDADPKAWSAFRSQASQWGRKMAKEHGRILDAITLRLDAKHVSPQQLAQFFAKNPAFFQEALRVVPPENQASLLG